MTVGWVEVTSATVEEAKQAALGELGVDEADAEFEILEEPKAGLFGRLRSEARVRARVLSPPHRRSRSHDRRTEDQEGLALTAGMKGEDPVQLMPMRLAANRSMAAAPPPPHSSAVSMQEVAPLENPGVYTPETTFAIESYGAVKAAYERTIRSSSGRRGEDNLQDSSEGSATGDSEQVECGRDETGDTGDEVFRRMEKTCREIRDTARQLIEAVVLITSNDNSYESQSPAKGPLTSSPREVAEATSDLHLAVADLAAKCARIASELLDQGFTVSAVTLLVDLARVAPPYGVHSLRDVSLRVALSLQQLDEHTVRSLAIAVPPTPVHSAVLSPLMSALHPSIEDQPSPTILDSIGSEEFDQVLRQLSIGSSSTSTYQDPGSDAAFTASVLTIARRLGEDDLASDELIRIAGEARRLPESECVETLFASIIERALTRDDATLLAVRNRLALRESWAPDDSIRQRLAEKLSWRAGGPRKVTTIPGHLPIFALAENGGEVLVLRSANRILVLKPPAFAPCYSPIEVPLGYSLTGEMRTNELQTHLYFKSTNSGWFTLAVATGSFERGSGTHPGGQLYPTSAETLVGGRWRLFAGGFEFQIRQGVESGRGVPGCVEIFDPNTSELLVRFEFPIRSAAVSNWGEYVALGTSEQVDVFRVG